jgi:multidrug efflux pump subunit AcrB
MDAAVRGVREVGGAVFASTLTTIAVFFPIVFVKGIAGQIFGSQAMTVVFSLLASLLVALFFIPMLASRQIKAIRVPGFASRGAGNPGPGSPTEEDINFLRFDSLVKPKEAGARIFMVPFRGLLELFAKLFLILLAVICLMGRTLAILIFGICFILILPPLIFRRFFERRVQRSTETSIFGLTFFSRIWPNLMSFQALEELRNAPRQFGVLWRTVKNGLRRLLTGRPESIILTVLIFPFRILLVPLWALIISPLLFVLLCFYVVLRFFLHLIFAVLGKAVILLFTFIAAVLIFFGGMAGLILYLILYIPLRLFNWFFEVINRIYPRVISLALRQPYAVVAIAALLLAVSIYFILPAIGSELIPQVHQGEFDVEVKLPVGTPLEKTDRVIREIEDRIISLPGVTKVAATVGVEKESYSDSDEGENTARLLVSLEPSKQPILLEERTIRAVRASLTDLPDVETRISLPAIFSFKTPIEVEARGYNLVELRRVAEDVVGTLQGIEGLYDVETNTEKGNPEVEIVYDRDKLARYNLNIYDVASLVRNKIRGDVATKFRKREKKIDVLVRLTEQDKETIENLKKIIINPRDPIPVPLEAVADVRIKEGPAEIRRIDQQRAALITANISGADLGSMSSRIEEELRTIRVPDDFSFTISGQNKEMEVSRQSMMAALILAIFLVYVVMASQFESLIHPFVIMFTIPLAIIGVVLVLFITNTPFSVVVYIGMIMLAGIVVNNAIILIDYINQLRRRGMEKMEAIVKAGSVRLRPILMTTSTTVLGLLPLALGLGEGAEIRTPMAITVIAGLISSTLLTLVVIPTVYAILDRGRMEGARHEEIG